MEGVIAQQRDEIKGLNRSSLSSLKDTADFEFFGIIYSEGEEDCDSSISSNEGVLVDPEVNFQLWLYIAAVMHNERALKAYANGPPADIQEVELCLDTTCRPGQSDSRRSFEISTSEDVISARSFSDTMLGVKVLNALRETPCARDPDKYLTDDGVNRLMILAVRFAQTSIPPLSGGVSKQHFQMP